MIQIVQKFSEEFALRVEVQGPGEDEETKRKDKKEEEERPNFPMAMMSNGQLTS